MRPDTADYSAAFKPSIASRSVFTASPLYQQGGMSKVGFLGQKSRQAASNKKKPVMLLPRKGMPLTQTHIGQQQPDWPAWAELLAIAG
jgi:hypothetical protein